MLNGESIHNWEDKWLLGVKDRKLKYPGNIDGSSPTRVAEIICLEELDKLVWPFTAVGQYSMKSGYKELRKFYGNESSLQPSSSHLIDRSTWKAIWSLQVPNKVKIFLWKLCHNAIPSRFNPWKRKCVSNPICCLCGIEDETLHILFLVVIGLGEYSMRLVLVFKG